ncbi:MAG: monovalent cation/H+ antiporter subunit D family protein [Archaeoglobaceae archaeon]|nr:monovalent cation/H+ antiporter subunit D family protein [Archaeoglobaceae archaeon]MCX8152762.1 monovalent cation/H+ antiporter subunit D family protein [Archaeoglobaceae archaeon]MDW8013469.1 monovalent cation/H+ antiporter subunit D family protein [Archaeoglobaceae archaeon]
MNDIAVHQFPVLIVTTGVFSALTILVVGLFNRKLCYYIVLFTTTFHFVLSILTLNHVLTKGRIQYWLGGWRPPWGIEYVVDELNAYVLVVILFLSFLGIVYSKRSVEKEIDERKHPTFYTLMQLLIAGCCGVVVTGDVFNLFVLAEVASLSTYALVAVAGGRALRASYNYLILGSLGICFYLLGIGFLYAVTGTLNMIDMKILLQNLYYNKMVQVAFVLVLVGLGIKAAVFPLHTWQPDAYTYAPSAVTLIMSTVVAKAFIYALIRLVFSVFTIDFLKIYVDAWSLIPVISAVAIVVASILAYRQNDIKRMLAYSSVVNIAYITLGISYFTSHWSLSGALVNILNHAIAKGCAFAAVGAIIYKTGIKDIRNYAGLAKKMPYTSAALLIAMLSLIGLPPSVGFVTKFYLAIGSLEVQNYLMLAIILLGTLLTLAYFLKVIEELYFKHSENNAEEAPLSMLAPTMFLAILCLAFGVYWLTGIPLDFVEKLVTVIR